MFAVLGKDVSSYLQIRPIKSCRSPKESRSSPSPFNPYQHYKALVEFNDTLAI